MGYLDREAIKNLTQATKDLIQVNRILLKKIIRLENTLYKSNKTLEKRITNQALFEERIFTEIDQISKEIVRFVNETDLKFVSFGSMRGIYAQLRPFFQKSFVFLSVIVLIIIIDKIVALCIKTFSKSKKSYLERISK